MPPHQKTLWRPKGNTWEPRDRDAALIIRPAKPEDLPPQQPKFLPSPKERVASQIRESQLRLAKFQAEAEARALVRPASAHSKPYDPYLHDHPYAAIDKFRAQLGATPPAFTIQRAGPSFVCTCSLLLRNGNRVDRQASGHTAKQAQRSAAHRMADHLSALAHAVIPGAEHQLTANPVGSLQEMLVGTMLEPPPRYAISRRRKDHFDCQCTVIFGCHGIVSCTASGRTKAICKQAAAAAILLKLCHLLEHTPYSPSDGIPTTHGAGPTPSPLVLALSKRWWAAHQKRDYAVSNPLQAKIAASGWTLRYTAERYRLEPNRHLRESAFFPTKSHTTVAGLGPAVPPATPQDRKKAPTAP